MPTIIANQTFNDTIPSSQLEQQITQEVLIDILKELKKLNINVSIMSDNEITDQELE